MDDENIRLIYEIYKREPIQFLKNIEQFLENIKTERELNPIKPLSDIDEIKNRIKVFYNFLENMKKELNTRYYKSEKEVINDLYNVLKIINNINISNTIEKIIDNAQNIYSVLDNMKKKSPVNSKTDISNILYNIEELNVHFKSLDKALNNTKNMKTLRISDLTYNIGSLMITLSGIISSMTYIRVNQIPDPDYIINDIGILIIYLREINNNLNSKENIPDYIKKKVEETIQNIYVNVFDNVLNSTDKYINKFSEILNEKYRNYGIYIIRNLSFIINTLDYLSGEKDKNSEKAKNIKKSIYGILEYFYNLQTEIEKEVNQKNYKSGKELMEYIYDNLDHLNVNKIIDIIEKEMPNYYIEIIKVVTDKLNKYIKQDYA